ncbi:hypothetical protein [Paenibacillus campinasensis]|nr:hypothetical protein [Paenibacillus campinasensis]
MAGWIWAAEADIRSGMDMSPVSASAAKGKLQRRDQAGFDGGFLLR